ncbi:uncharacterized protein LOC119658276 [Hermetia illucens]|uniref:uncharacterized protein LOC119658276 n=1 Tax=Hermetia illucens TaxID=343691 RepID=UPI0018CC1907|nr:uncharacterized protein LOC119658276 [Hermetia illucens]
MSLNKALVAVSVFPGGIIFGFYLFYHLFASDDVIKLLWPLISAPVCAVIISCLITIKKRIQEKYTFDNLYYNSVACGFYIVSGLFFLRHSLDIALYFGFAGSGITYISSITYCGYIAANTKERHRGVAGVYLFHFTGIVVASALHVYLLTNDEAETKCGLVMLGSSIFILGILISNQILNYCGLNNYRTSGDNLWNYYNARNWLYKNRPDTMAIHQRMDNRYRQPTFAIVKSKESVTIFFIVLVSITNFMMFCHVTFELGSAVFLTVFKSGGSCWLLLVAEAGIILSLSLQTCLGPKTIYTIFGIIKCAVLVCLLLFFDSYSQSNAYVIYFFVCFLCMGVLYPLSNTMLLEVANPRNCEIVFSVAYLTQLLVLFIVAFFSKRYSEYVSDFRSFIKILYIAYIVMSLLAIVIVQIFSPISGSLIEIRNYLLGIRKSKTIVSFRDV